MTTNVGASCQFDHHINEGKQPQNNLFVCFQGEYFVMRRWYKISKILGNGLPGNTASF